ncbi:MAG TPA: carboxypeptidase-like regulatory domain-containing protein, partial [Pyrinomonadaceae bacterium]|nr:carboxypeptidase-like regulatory domain-containing protein [Pyrinomonadaceae bacterium]
MRILRRAALALALVSAAGFTAARAQAKSCNLNIEVQETNADGPPVEHASATATSLKTKRRFRAVAFEGMPVFGRLPAGRYSVTVTKRGYATAVKEVNLTCANLEPDDPSETEHVFLQKAGAAVAIGGVRGATGDGVGAGVGRGTGAGTTASGIRDVDFLNHTYTASGCATDAELPKTVKVTGGEFKNEESLFYNVRADEIGYGDLNGDGSEEAIVQIRCGSSAGTLRAFEIQAFTLRGGSATLLARL